jgi:hypothetical protein
MTRPYPLLLNVSILDVDLERTLYPLTLSDRPPQGREYRQGRFIIDRFMAP